MNQLEYTTELAKIDKSLKKLLDKKSRITREYNKGRWTR